MISSCLPCQFHWLIGWTRQVQIVVLDLMGTVRLEAIKPQRHNCKLTLNLVFSTCNSFAVD